jgi:hypothetical protein
MQHPVTATQEGIPHTVAEKTFKAKVASDE